MAEIVPVVSEALEAQVRDLLPSQRGFGEDLQASNVITPIIDLTAVAQGTTTPQYLQTALAFGSQTSISISNTTTVIANTPGFYRIFGVSNVLFGGGNFLNDFSLSDGLSTKFIWQHLNFNSTQTGNTNLQFDFTVFLATGISLSGRSNSASSSIAGTSRQVADVNGNLVNPSGFTPQ